MNGRLSSDLKHSHMTSITGKELRVIYYLTLIVFFLGHLYYITAPPNGYHKPRESDTATVALNYYHDDMSFARPRVNIPGNADGVTGMELPVYNYAVALLYHLTGPSHLAARLVTLLAALAGLWFLKRIVTTLVDELTAVFATAAMALSPLYFFYSGKIMPDIPMLALWLGAIFCFLQHLKTRRPGYWFLSAVLLVLSAAIKPLGLSVYLPLAYLMWTDKQRPKGQLVLFAVYVVATLTLPLLWMLYARQLQAESGLGFKFYLGNNLTDFYRFLFRFQFWKKNIFQWPWELWIGWALTPLFAYGAYLWVKKRKPVVFLLWAVASFLVLALVSAQTTSHDYYTLIMVPPLAAATGLGAKELWERGSRWRTVIIVLLVLAPAGIAARIHTRFGEINDFYQIRSAVQDVIPRGERVMVEDSSGANRLYELDRKGWPLRSRIDVRTVQSYVERGGKFLLLLNPIEQYDDSLRLLFDTSGRKLGPLHCYRLKE
jgi:hypothetical protein